MELERQVRMIRPIPRSNDPTVIEVTYGWIPAKAARQGQKHGNWRIDEVWGKRVKKGSDLKIGETANWA